MLVVAHLSDTHVNGDPRRAERAARVMAYLRALPGRVDAVLVTGDVADRGRADEYRQASELLGMVAPLPVLTCPGNHDDRDAYRKALGAGAEPAGDGAPVNEARVVGGVLFALCDSTVPGEAGGLLAGGTLDWLQGLLERSPAGTPVLVCFHHPPVALHSPVVDAIRQRGERRLADLVARHPQVVAMLCGHAHTPAATTFAGKPLLVAPGISSTLRLPWERRADEFDESRPPAVAFHVLDDDRRLTTHYRAVP